MSMSSLFSSIGDAGASRTKAFQLGAGLNPPMYEGQYRKQAKGLVDSRRAFRPVKGSGKPSAHEYVPHGRGSETRPPSLDAKTRWVLRGHFDSGMFVSGDMVEYDQRGHQQLSKSGVFRGEPGKECLAEGTVTKWNDQEVIYSQQEGTFSEKGRLTQGTSRIYYPDSGQLSQVLSGHFDSKTGWLQKGYIESYNKDGVVMNRLEGTVQPRNPPSKDLHVLTGEEKFFDDAGRLVTATFKTDGCIVRQYRFTYRASASSSPATAANPPDALAPHHLLPADFLYPLPDEVVGLSPAPLDIAHLTQFSKCEIENNTLRTLVLQPSRRSLCYRQPAPTVMPTGLQGSEPLCHGPHCEVEFQYSSGSRTIYRGARDRGLPHGQGEQLQLPGPGHSSEIRYSGLWVAGKLQRGFKTTGGKREPYLYWKGKSHEVRSLLSLLRAELENEVAGQSIAVSQVLQPLLRRWLGWTPPNKPLVLCFAGPSGVGKTKMAKGLAHLIDCLTPDIFERSPNAAVTSLIRIDMSEYSEKHSVSRFHGTSPGYVGYQDGGQLVNALRAQPSPVVLFDEIEKAHPDILSALLHLFDEGRLSDGKGTTVHCPDAIFIMTTNLGSTQITEELVNTLRQEVASHQHQQPPATTGKAFSFADAVGTAPEDLEVSRLIAKRVVIPAFLKYSNRPEFIGRITEIIPFFPLDLAALASVFEIALEAWIKHAATYHSIRLLRDVSRHHVLQLVALYLDTALFGARNLEAEIERALLYSLVDMQVQGLLTPGATFRIICKLPPIPPSNGAPLPAFLGEALGIVREPDAAAPPSAPFVELTECFSCGLLASNNKYLCPGCVQSAHLHHHLGQWHWYPAAASRQCAQCAAASSMATTSGI